MDFVIKRNGVQEEFNPTKITNAILKTASSIEVSESESNFSNITNEVLTKIKNESTGSSIRVDYIDDLVENALMDNQLNNIAKAYISYRLQKKPNIFNKRVNLKPYEYPNLAEYVDAIRHSYWVHTEFNFTSDIQDFKVLLDEKEQTAVQRAMLAISQIEIAVKTFWGDIYKKMPKPEIGAVGATFAESEVRHADAYSNLLKILGLNDEFESLMDVPAIRKRIKYLEKSIGNTRSIENKDYFESVILFSMFIENVSLFSQFLVILAFNKHKNVLKGMSNVVEATSKEEKIHAEFGFDLVNLIKAENPDWWTEELKADLVDAAIDAFDAEQGVIDWIFEKGDLDFLTKEETIEFVKDRFNQSLIAIGLEPAFVVDDEILQTTEWLTDEILTTKHTDFFNKRSINYSKKQKSVTSDDLF